MAKYDFLPQYVFSGTYKQVGQQHGEELRTEIQDYVKVTMDKAMAKFGDKQKVLDMAAGYKPYVEKFAPGLATEVFGLAEGANISFNEAMLLQVRVEAFNPEKMDAALECTGYAVNSTYTSDGKVYAGQNVDLEVGEDYSYVAVFAVEGRPKVMMPTAPGRISTLGWNDHGLSATVNYLSSAKVKFGFPRYMITRAFLECATLEEGLKRVTQIQPWSLARNMLVCDKDGNMADYEFNPEGGHVIRTKKGFMVHTNHYLAPETTKFEISPAEYIVNSSDRFNRMTTLIEENKGKINSAKIKTFLSDHENGLNSICMHEPPIASYCHCSISMITNLTDGYTEICSGNPCQGRYGVYKF